MVNHLWHIRSSIFPEFELHNTHHDSYRVFFENRVKSKWNELETAHCSNTTKVPGLSSTQTP
jgi:hypothetical protein